MHTNEKNYRRSISRLIAIAGMVVIGLTVIVLPGQSVAVALICTLIGAVWFHISLSPGALFGFSLTVIDWKRGLEWWVVGTKEAGAVACLRSIISYSVILGLLLISILVKGGYMAFLKFASPVLGTECGLLLGFVLISRYIQSRDV